jgi:hypothetical protein
MAEKKSANKKAALQQRKQEINAHLKSLEKTKKELDTGLREVKKHLAGWRHYSGDPGGS